MNEAPRTLVFLQGLRNGRGQGWSNRMAGLPAGEVCNLSASLCPLSPEWGHLRLGSPGSKTEEGTPALPKYLCKQLTGQLVILEMKSRTGGRARRQSKNGGRIGWGWGLGAGHHFPALINNAGN